MFSFSVSNPVIEEILRTKSRNGEISAYINEALAFHENYASDLAEIKQMIAQIQDMLASQGIAAKNLPARNNGINTVSEPVPEAVHAPGEGEEELEFDIKDVQTAQDRDLADPFFQLETDPEILRLFKEGQ